MLPKEFSGLKDICLDYKVEFLEAYLGEGSIQQGYGFCDLVKVESIIKRPLRGLKMLVNKLGVRFRKYLPSRRLSLRFDLRL